MFTGSEDRELEMILCNDGVFESNLDGDNERGFGFSLGIRKESDTGLEEYIVIGDGVFEYSDER